MFDYFDQLWSDGFEHPIRVIGGGNHFFTPKGMDLVDWIKKKHKIHFESGKIIFEGHIEPKNISQRLANAHVVIVPSIMDNLPYAVIEAMSYGKIVLGSNKSGHQELINGTDNGFIFEHNFHSFKAELLKILALNSNEISNISNNAKNTVSQLLNYEKIANGKINLIQNTENSRALYPFTRNINNTKISSGIEDILLSVIIPFYNLGEYIEETLISLKQCDYKYIEVIVVNDGSDEKNTKKLEELEKEYNFNIFNKPNTGLSLTRNYGVDRAKGKYIAFLDADDTVEPSYYSKAINILKHYENVSFVGCWAKYFGESSDIWPTFIPEPPYLLMHNMINSSALVYKKEAFLKSGLNKQEMIYGMEDYESVINLVSNGYRGTVINEPLWNYRIRKNSMAQSFNNSSELFLYDKIAQNHPLFFEKYSIELSMLVNSNGSGLNIDNPTFGVTPSDNLIQRLNPKLINFVKKNRPLRFLAKKIINRLN